MSYLKQSLHRCAMDLHNWLLPLVTINILWFLLSLTVVLFPPATAALFEIAFQANRGREPYIQDYLIAIRKWFIKSWIWAIISLILLLASITSFVFFYSYSQRSSLGYSLLIISLSISAFIGLVQLHFWPYMFFQDFPQIIPAFRNASLTVLSDPLFALWNAGIALLLVLVSVLLLAPIALFAPITFAFVSLYNLHAWLGHRELINE